MTSGEWKGQSISSRASCSGLPAGLCYADSVFIINGSRGDPYGASCGRPGLPHILADKGAGHSARTVGSAGQPPGFTSRAWRGPQGQAGSSRVPSPSRRSYSGHQLRLGPCQGDHPVCDYVLAFILGFGSLLHLRAEKAGPFNHWPEVCFVFCCWFFLLIVLV